MPCPTASLTKDPALTPILGKKKQKKNKTSKRTPPVGFYSILLIGNKRSLKAKISFFLNLHTYNFQTSNIVILPHGLSLITTFPIAGGKTRAAHRRCETRRDHRASRILTIHPGLRWCVYSPAQLEGIACSFFPVFQIIPPISTRGAASTPKPRQLYPTSERKAPAVASSPS